MPRSPPKLEVLLPTSCSRPSSLWWAAPPAPGLTGGVAWSPAAWSVLEETESWPAATWVWFIYFSCLITVTIKTKSQPYTGISTFNSSKAFAIICDVALCSSAGRLRRSPELSEPWWVLGRARRGELRLQLGLQLPQEALGLHSGQRLHPLDQQRE